MCRIVVKQTVCMNLKRCISEQRCRLKVKTLQPRTVWLVFNRNLFCYYYRIIIIYYIISSYISSTSKHQGLCGACRLYMTFDQHKGAGWCYFSISPSLETQVVIVGRTLDVARHIFCLPAGSGLCVVASALWSPLSSSWSKTVKFAPDRHHISIKVSLRWHNWPLPTCIIGFCPNNS